MTYFANPASDLPAPYKPKRVIIYAQGLKIYGLTPYIMAKRLHAKFISNDFSILGGMGRIIAPTLEDNYTLVRWRRDDGTEHSQAAIDALLNWLYADAGFQIGVATREFFNDDLDLPNVYQRPPITFVPALSEHRAFFVKALGAGRVSHEETRVIDG